MRSSPKVHERLEQPVERIADDSQSFDVSQLKKHTAGRGNHNDVVLPNASVSKTAFTFWGIGARTIRISGVHSANGIWVNGTRVENSHDVDLDDQIDFGDYTIGVAELVRKAIAEQQLFISYSRNDRDVARSIKQFLSSKGWPVWWDEQLTIGRAFDEEIENQIRNCRCVVVLWSVSSVQSQWVRAEAGIALDSSKLVPVFIEPVEAPLLFRQIQGVFLTAQQPKERERELEVLAERLEHLIGPPG